LLLCSCGITSGTVTGKGHDDAYSVTTVTTIGNCTCYPETTYYDECWRLDLRRGNDTGSVCVDRARWDATPVGAVVTT
ncbi:hypothetical protein B7P34_36160, partial [Streptosporangium nondiastaticum]